ncbi:ABC-three component system protein [Sporosarcina sp. 179-K 8C2 HS]|uniref:ABC-three component system protein n=1 Tax=Sporosarcina sp. 179-K 8C2 HS TaxID=3142387 RepID=UPI0039A2772C
MAEFIKYEMLDISAPEVTHQLTNQQLILGTLIAPIDKIKTFSDKQFEDIIREWADGYLKTKYNKVYRCGGAGDMGRDVIGYKNYREEKENLIWDNYQCKHYKNALNPSDIWLEIGKLCYYTYIKAYNVPQNYYFVCANSVSIALHDLLNDPEELKRQFIENWENSVKKKITNTKHIELDKDLLLHIDTNIDFGIFTYLDPHELIEQHRQTPYFSYRFGGGLHKPRPKPLAPPEEVHERELTYVNKLFRAYEDYTKSSITKEEELGSLIGHFQRQRTHFYQADSLMKFERDTIPPNVNAFKELKDELFYGIVDTVEDRSFSSGYERVKSVTEKARLMNLTNNNPLNSVLTKNDQHGMCHHLANENKIDWVTSNE